MARPRSSRTGAGVRSAARPVQEAPRADHLVVARESARYDSRLMEGMVQQTLAMFPQLPGRERLEQAGLGPLTDPAAYGTRPESRGRDGQWVVFEMDGTWCFYFMGSATRADESGDNLFCEQLCAVLAWLRPRNVMISTFSRLVRSHEFSGPVYASVLDNVDVVHADTRRIDLREETGKTFWQILSMFSTMERDSQMLRLTLGQIARFKQGDWLPGRKAVPLGYRLDDRRLVLDPGAAPAVRAVLEQVGTRQTGPEFVAALDRLGLATPSQTGAGWAYDGGPPTRPGMTIGRLAQPEVRRRQFENLVEMYASGEYVFEWEVPVSAGDSIGGIPIQPETWENNQRVRPRYIELVYRLPVPPEGWAPDAVLGAARAVRDRERIHDGRRGVQPLALALAELPGRDGLQQKLTSHSRESVGHPAAYKLFERRPEDGARAPSSGYKRALSGWKHQGKHVGTLVAVVDAAELHRSLAETIACGIATGTAAERLDGLADYRLHAGSVRTEATHAEEVRRLEGELAAASAETARAAADLSRTVAALATAEHGLDPDLAARLAGPANAAAARERDVRERLTALRESAPVPGDPGDEFTCEADMLVRILAGLASGPPRVPAPVARDIAAVLDGLSFGYDEDWVTWSTRVLVPADGGWIAALGPFHGRARRRGSTGSTVPAQDRAKSLARAILRDGHGVDELLAREDGAVRADPRKAGVQGRQARRRARAWLVAQGMGARAASTAMLCSVPQTRRAIWALLAGEALPQGIDPAFAQTLQAVYLDGDLRRAVWFNPPQDRQTVLDYLVARGGTAMLSEAAAHLRAVQPGRPAPHVYLAVRQYARPLNGHPPSYRLPDAPPCANHLRDCGDPGCGVHGLLTLVRCPHCGPGHWGSVNVCVPEIPTALLCPDCLRSPDPASGVHPAEYLSLTEASVEADLARRLPDVLYRRGEQRRSPDARPAAESTDG